LAIDTEFAFVTVRVNVVAPPLATNGGCAVIATVVAVVTVTVTAADLLPLEPVTVRV
jgi:hypothetical protein